MIFFLVAGFFLIVTFFFFWTALRGAWDEDEEIGWGAGRLNGAGLSSELAGLFAGFLLKYSGKKI